MDRIFIVETGIGNIPGKEALVSQRSRKVSLLGNSKKACLSGR